MYTCFVAPIAIRPNLANTTPNAPVLGALEPWCCAANAGPGLKAIRRFAFLKVGTPSPCKASPLRPNPKG